MCMFHTMTRRKKNGKMQNDFPKPSISRKDIILPLLFPMTGNGCCSTAMIKTATAIFTNLFYKEKHGANQLNFLHQSTVMIMNHPQVFPQTVIPYILSATAKAGKVDAIFGCACKIMTVNGEQQKILAM